MDIRRRDILRTAVAALLALSARARVGAHAVHGSSESRRAALGERVALRVGEAVLIGNDGLEIGVDAIVADSRCPKGERCAREGEAVVRVWLRQGQGPRETRDVQLSARAPGVATALDHEVRLFRLDPEPVSGRATPPAEYVATLQVVPGSDAAPDR